MKPRICLISGVIARSGGTERVGSILAGGLAARGYQVYLLSFWNQGPPHYPLSREVRVSYLLSPGKEGKLYRTYLYPVAKLHRFLKKHRIQVAVDIDTELSRFTALAIRGTGCRLISWEHFNYWTMERLQEKKRFLAKRLIRKYGSALVLLTEEDRRKHNAVYRLPEGFGVTIPNPCPAVTPGSYSFGEKRFVSVGRLAYEKGYDLLLQAWQKVEQAAPDWELQIAGDGEERQRLLQQKEALGLRRVTFLGRCDPVEPVYRRASACVLSSRYEGFPMVLLEAQAYGLPVIAFACRTGPEELVEPGKNGFLAAPGNPDQLAEAMIMFTKDRQRAEAMSARAAESVGKYDLERILDRWEDLIRRVTA